MSERRMFAKTIIDSDAFLDMPTSAQALYFHLGMRADDEGFVNAPKKIMRSVGSNDDDLRLLIAKRFLIPFDSGVVVIKHWRIHNYIRGDRLHETAYEEERAMLTIKKNGAYSIGDDVMSVTCQSTDGQLTVNCPSNVSIGKDSIGKDSIGQDSKGKGARRFAPPSLQDVKGYISEKHITIDAEAFVDFYASKGWKVGNQTMRDWKAAVRNWARRDAERKTTTTSTGSARKTSFHNFEERQTAGGSWDELEPLVMPSQKSEDTGESWEEMLEKWRSKRGKKD